MNRLYNALWIWLLIACLAACSPEKQTSNASVIDVAEASQILGQDPNVMVLDVRTPEEFDSGHIEGAVNINIYSNDFAKKVNLLDKDKRYIVHCAANVENGRSAKSLNIMDSLGFKGLMSLKGGMVAWQKAGQKVTAANAP